MTGGGARSDLAGATATGPNGGASSPGLSAGTSGTASRAGVSPSGASAGIGARALLAGSGSGGGPEGGTGGTTTDGEATTTGVPNGGASLLGRLGTAAGELPLHGHLDDPGGGRIDYARLLVSTTSPPAPVAPSDAFWLNPSEVA